MQIKAKFDDIDSAEIALIRLRQQGIEPLGYKMRRESIKKTEPFSGLENAVTGFVNLVAPEKIHIKSAAEKIDNDDKTVELSVIVADNLAFKTEQSLVSNHGLNIRFG